MFPISCSPDVIPVDRGQRFVVRDELRVVVPMLTLVQVAPQLSTMQSRRGSSVGRTACAVISRVHVVLKTTMPLISSDTANGPAAVGAHVMPPSVLPQHVRARRASPGARDEQVGAGL
jgi:hypothetical protein